MRYPAGSWSPAFLGGGMARPSSILALVPGVLSLRLVRVAMSVLASVVSDGSPGSSLSILGPMISPDKGSAAALERVLGRFAGGLADSIDSEAFLCLRLVVNCAVESSASSPEASRDEGWRRSTVDGCSATPGNTEFLFRLPEPEDDGEDIIRRATPQWALALLRRPESVLWPTDSPY